MIRCGSSTEVTLLSSGEKVPVLCRLDDSHTCDHEGRFDGGMLLHWPRLPTSPLVITINAESIPIVVLQPRPTNAACVIGVGDDPYVAPRIMVGGSWESKPSNPVDDIKAAAEQIRREHIAGPRPRHPTEQARYKEIGRRLSEYAARLPPPDPFPIEDAGPHPKDEK
jgi:hypothetical protein